MRFQGKAALLTGAGGGVGRAIGEALGREGADLVLVDNVEEAMAPLATTLRAAGRRVLEVPADVTVNPMSSWSSSAPRPSSSGSMC